MRIFAPAKLTTKTVNGSEHLKLKKNFFLSLKVLKIFERGNDRSWKFTSIGRKSMSNDKYVGNYEILYFHFKTSL